MSPVEVERKKRQLLKNNRQRRQTEGEEGALGPAAANAEENMRARRQTTDPDQLCPTVATFVMPRAAVNTAGDWMFIVNMGDSEEFQQLVRAELCM